METLDLKKKQKKKILLVDDDTELTAILKTRFESVGYRVRTAASGQAALSCVKEETPDLVVLDLGLPDISGYEVCRRLREFSKPWRIPVLMLTGRSDPSDQLQGFAFGADAYLTKPCDSARLLKAIEELLSDSAEGRRKELPKELLENPQALTNLQNIFNALREGSVKPADADFPRVPVTPPKGESRKGVNNQRVLLAGVGVALLIFLAIVLFPKAPSPGLSRFQITEAVLCLDVNKDRSLVGATTEFPAGTGKVVCRFSWKGAPPNLSLTGRWYYVTQESPILNIPVTLTQDSSEATFLLRMPLGEALPVGMYRFDIMLQGKVLKTIPFAVGVEKTS